MPTRDIVVIGGSAGAIVALKKILRGLPAELAASIFVVIHTNPDNPSVLPEVLSRAGRLPANATTDGAPIQPGQIYLPPPDHHLLLKRGHVRITRGPRENGFRPAIDPLFRTAADAYGPRVIGVILSGGLDDGVLGLSRVKRRGGITIAQDPNDAEAPSMPESAIRQVTVDHVLRADDIASLLTGLVRTEVKEDTMAANDGPPRDIAEVGTDALDSGILPKHPSPFTCPECGGALWELKDGDLVRFQCHVGHAYSPESLISAQSDGLEAALWTALRALEESSALRKRMADHARQKGMAAIAEAYEEHAQQSEARAQVVRRILVTDPREKGYKERS